MNQAELDALAKEYQADQESLAAKLTAWVLAWWTKVDYHAGPSFDAYARKVRDAHTESIQLARAFHNASRRAAVPGLGNLPASNTSAVFLEGALRKNFNTETAPLAERGRLDDPDFMAELESLGKPLSATAAHVAKKGGREALANAREADPEVIGYYRKTDADPCGFCAMLASRGAAYTEDRNTAKAGRKWSDQENPDQYHPGCNCQVLPLFRGQSMPAEDNRKRAEWAQRFKDTPGSGPAQARAFQTAINAERKERLAANG
ncbi:hypothetical protein ACGFYT_30105 [Streptomyces sp. NPDC048208]|uniref:VG15 protein n=1 Tax=Streptomyces sp. NPDC048208 TaxID=3365515 RepID=UPI0037163A5C